VANTRQTWPRASGVRTKPVLDLRAWGECRREIGRREVDGEVRSLVAVDWMYMSTVDGTIVIIC
jgi:hypothetical protein